MRLRRLVNLSLERLLFLFLFGSVASLRFADRPAPAASSRDQAVRILVQLLKMLLDSVP